jgi:hypothetical protein
MDSLVRGSRSLFGQIKCLLRKTRYLCLLIPFAVALFAATAHAQGGPPFRTDDPDTPGNRHWEINYGFIGDRNPGTGAYQVPDFDINYGLGDRIQLKYELPISIEETRPAPASGGVPSTSGRVIAGVGESLLGVKWRFFEHHPGDASIGGDFGTGLLALFGHHAQTEPASVSGDSPGAADEATATGEKEPSFELGTYPQLYLDNPTRAVPRGLVASGPNFYLPIEVSGRIGPIRYNADTGYNFGNRSLPQSWNRGFLVGHEFSDRTEAYVELYDLQDANRVPIGRGAGNFAASGVKQRETTLGLGGRQALNHGKTLNLLLMAGRSFQTPSAATGQPGWIAYVGVQMLFGHKEAEKPQLSPADTTPPRPGVRR